jgi:hypothetical protein
VRALSSVLGAVLHKSAMSMSTTNPLPALQHKDVLSTIGKTPLIRLNRCCCYLLLYMRCDAHCAHLQDIAYGISLTATM